MPAPDRLNFGLFLAPFHRLGDAMGHVGGGPDQIAGHGFEDLVADRHSRLSGKDQIEFVSPLMDMDGLALTGFEAVEPEKHPSPAHQI